VTTMRSRVVGMLAAGLVWAAVAGCGGPKQPDFPDLNPVTGTLQRAGQPVSGGSVRFDPDPARPEFQTNSEVGADGTFTLSTVRTTDKTGERKRGAPVGTYRVTYMPPLADQTAGSSQI